MEEHSWIFKQIELSRHHNLRVFWFLKLLESFLRPRSARNQNLIEGIGRNHILNAISVFEIAEWKAMNLMINWIISSTSLGWITCFYLNISSFSIRFTFWIVIKFNFVLISVFNNFCDWISISISNFDFSANSNSNLLIFDSVDSYWGYLS